MKCLAVFITIVAIKCINVTGENNGHSKRLCVGGLSYAVDDDDLRKLFKPFGTVKFVNVIKDIDSGRSKGFGFIEMSTYEESKAAIDALNGKVYKKRIITIVEANEPGTTLRPRDHKKTGDKQFKLKINPPRVPIKIQ